MTVPDPIARFTEWLEDARKLPDYPEPWMVVATSTPDGRPSARVVLLKGIDERGFVFYTNNESRKGGELRANPQAALCFYWQPLGRQARVEGSVEPVSREEADAYFASRRRESRIGAWGSRQSRPLESRAQLERAVAEYEEKFAGKDVPRPPHWHGWRLVPERIEFWTEGGYRLHDRELFTRPSPGAPWRMQRLYP